jgi:hypothetical protein
VFDEWTGKDVRDKVLSVGVAASARRSTQVLDAAWLNVVSYSCAGSSRIRSVMA